jgi:DNA-directed RNA polymerase subunit M/transcription elongation factor TFIIS
LSFCPRCGRTLDKDNRSNAAVCSMCGASVQLPTRSLSVAVCAAPASEKKEYSYCMRCGKTIYGTSKFCRFCESRRAEEIPSL